MVNGLPVITRLLNQHDIQEAKTNNQFAVYGAAAAFVPLDTSVVFVEYVVGTNIVLKDAAGTAITGTLASGGDFGNSPIRIEGGFTSTGTSTLIKGFYLKAN